MTATEQIELVLVLGDLAELGTREELAAAKEILDRLRAPYYPVPGNQDGPPDRPPGSGDAGLAAYNELFPGRRNYTFAHKGWQFVGLDTTDGSGYQQLPVTAETLAFAGRVAAELDPRRPTIAFTHFPIDPSIRFNLANGFELLDRLAPLNLRIVFSGHFHGRTVNRAPRRPELQLVTNTCCSHCREIHDGTTARGYYRCRANEDETVSFEFVEWAGESA